MITTKGEHQKVQALITDESRSAFSRYLDLVVGLRSLWSLIKFETITGLFGGLPGALGLLLRKRFYPLLFRQVGSGVVFGRNIVLRHPSKIELGDKVVIDDNCVLDARGQSNRGLRIGNDVILARNTILGCKDGDIDIGDGVGIGAYTIIHAIGGNRVHIGDNVLIAAFTYLVGGGEYHTERIDIPIAKQGMRLKGGIRVEYNTWIGARVTVSDGITIGHDSIIGAGAVVLESVEPLAVAVGIPARIIRKRTEISLGKMGNNPTKTGT